jgi:hypothetical protein
MRPAQKAFAALIVASLIFLPAWSSGRKSLVSHYSKAVRSGGSVSREGGSARFFMAPGGSTGNARIEAGTFLKGNNSEVAS